MNDFLERMSFFYDRVKLGIDAHPTDAEMAEFYRLAKLISPNQDFSYRGCQKCVNHMIKFVYDNKNRLDERN